MRLIATWDDAAREDLRVAELMARYEVPAVFYWPCALRKSENLKGVKEFLTLRECKEIAKSFTVGSHSYSHKHLKRDVLSVSQAEFEIFESRRFWQDETGQAVDTFCYPRGRFDPEYKEMVARAGYVGARGVGVGSLDGGDDPYYRSATVHVGIGRREYGGLSWLEYARSMVRVAGGMVDPVFHMFGHSWEIEGRGEWGNLESFLKELKS